jgi:NAD(P)-dependent dehydrogenase (short-subunit alcohol dehydrogenase family)
MEKAILVTGASRGIGAAIAEMLASAGYVVGCLSRSGALPDRPGARADVRDKWIPFCADVKDAHAMQLASEHLSRHGRLYGLVNNAGLHREADSSTMPIRDWDEIISVNATSTVIACQAAFGHMVAAGGGLIVNMGSFFDKLGVKRNMAYCASKAAVAAITRVLAVEWAAKGIRVINVAPGYVQTHLNRAAMTQGPLLSYLQRRIPAGGPAEADDIARIVAMLFQLDNPFLTGETIYVDGAQGIAL